MNGFPPEQPSDPASSGHHTAFPYGSDDALRIAQAAIAASPSGAASGGFVPASAPYGTHAAATAMVQPRTSGSRLRWLVAAVFVCFFVAGCFYYSSSRNAGGTFTGIGRGEAGSWNMSDESWSYYHQSNVNQDQYAPRWDKGFNSITTSSKWQYDGPYQYGTYGRAGMTARTKGQANGPAGADPIYGGSASIDAEVDDVFAQYGVDTADPTGGAPVGADPATLNPWYDPTAITRSNPYENRLRMTWGEAAQRDAWMR